MESNTIKICHKIEGKKKERKGYKEREKERK
jgi:hypothetical protein